MFVACILYKKLQTARCENKRRESLLKTRYVLSTSRPFCGLHGTEHLQLLVSDKFHVCVLPLTIIITNSYSNNNHHNNELPLQYRDQLHLPLLSVKRVAIRLQVYQQS
jgi:hypothetical protein